MIVGPDGVVQWSYGAASPGELPGANLIFDGLARRGVRDLGSAPVPGVDAEDHVRGPDDASLVIEYADFECPFCAALSVRLAGRAAAARVPPLPGAHEPPAGMAGGVRGRGGRGLQGRFWEMHDLLFADQGRLEDPHLWERAQRSASTSSASTPTVAATPSRPG